MTGSQTFLSYGYAPFFQSHYEVSPHIPCFHECPSLSQFESMPAYFAVPVACLSYDSQSSSSGFPCHL